MQLIMMMYFLHSPFNFGFRDALQACIKSAAKIALLIHHSDPVHSFNVKPIKMLSDPVAEAFGLIHRHPSGENFWHGVACSAWHDLQVQ